MSVHSKYFEIKDLVMSQAGSLDENLAYILSSLDSEGSFELHPSISVEKVNNHNGLCGYQFWENDFLLGQFFVGSLADGTYITHKKMHIGDELHDSYDYYDTEGKFAYNSTQQNGFIIQYASITMETLSPISNHFYNIIHLEYEGTAKNYGDTYRIAYIEGLFAQFFDNQKIPLGANDGLKDSALVRIKNEILRIESDNVLKWGERQEVFSAFKNIRKVILQTKRRVHGFNYFTYDVSVAIGTIKLKYQTFKKRPVNNFIGSAYRYTIGNLLWFIGTVRKNLGYSVALAIYGPFTFYFITQPMNPHAMWAVGKVRKAYIQVSKAFEPSAEEQLRIAQLDNATKVEQTSDSVNTLQAAVKKQSMKQISASSGGNWDSRMSNFKAMQIAYEGEMVFSARMGRIEQFETQFNFPLTAEAAWMEMELYLKKVQADLDYFKNLDQRYVSFLNKEKERTLELQFYIWQKMGQFFLDHPYIVVDQENEQSEKNYYVGRQFVFFKKMTKKLTDLGIANSPKTHKNIEKLAKYFQKMKVGGEGVLDSLNKNSKLFRQKNLLSSNEHRDYMVNQWETIFLQQNKKQEASSFALQAYTWSIRNAMWLLQTIYSSKRSELADMTYKYNLDNIGTQSTVASKATNEYLENMYHNLVMEFVGIRKEMNENLHGDNEAKMRENLIRNVKQYLADRDKLFNSGVYAAHNQADSTNI